jgi:hypothetical protein
MALSDESAHGGVTDEMMEQFFADHPDLRPLQPFGMGPTGVPPVGGVEGDDASEPSPPPSTPEPAPPGEGEPATTPEPAAPEPSPESPVGPTETDFVEIDGNRYARSQISAAAQFQQHLQSDPRLQQLITDYLTGAQQPQPQPAPQAPQAPAQQPYDPYADIDLDDPSIRALANIVRQQNDQIQQLSSVTRTTFDQSIAQQQQQIDAQYKTAATSFAKDHELDDGEVEEISRVAARLGVLPQLMQGMDPITGTPRPPDAIGAFSRALEIAMYQIPEYRDREFRRSVTNMQQEQQKRKLLGAVGGSSGSVARTTTPPKPGSPEAKRAMLAEVGAMLNGEWSDPTAN